MSLHKSSQRDKRGADAGAFVRREWPRSSGKAQVQRIAQPMPDCVLCGRKIDKIETAVAPERRFLDGALGSAVADVRAPDDAVLVQSPDPLADPVADPPSDPNEASAFDSLKDRLCHFDCVIGRIRESRQIKFPYSVSYLGSGFFAVIKSEKNKKDFICVEKLKVESLDDFRTIQEYVSGLRTQGSEK